MHHTTHYHANRHIITSHIHSKGPSLALDFYATYPGNVGCTCFEPTAGQVSFYNVNDAQDAGNTSAPNYGYRTAVDTSVAGGVTVAAWLKAGNTGDDRFPGQQTALVFTKGRLASWGMG